MSREVMTPPPISVTPEEPMRGRPWGLWKTIGWGSLIAVSFVLAQTLAMGVFAGVRMAQGEKIAVHELGTRGDILALGSLAAAPVAVILCLVAASLRKGITVGEYLALRPPRLKESLRWLGYGLVFMFISDLVTYLLGKPIVPDFMIEAYTSAGRAVPFLWLALLVAAPLSEEFFFRGFLFAGFRESPLRTAGAILLTSLLWAGIHLQYDLHGILLIFIGGIFIALARVRTGSLWTCILLHGWWNFIATVQVLIRTYYS